MARRSISAANCLQLDLSHHLRLPPATVYPRTFWNHKGSYFRYPPGVSYSKCENTLAKSYSEFGYRVSAKDHDCWFSVLPNYMSDPWNCCAHLFAASNNPRQKFLFGGLYGKRFFSQSRKNSILQAEHSDKHNAAPVVEKSKEGRAHSLIELFCDSQRAKFAAYGASKSGAEGMDLKVFTEKNATKTENLQNERKMRSVKNTEQNMESQQTKNAVAAGKKALSSATGTRSNKKSPPKTSDASSGSAVTKSGIRAIARKNAKKGSRKLTPLYPPSGKSVMVVESSTKAKTIQRYLGDMFDVLPSHGHVRDLAGRSGSVRPDDDFSMVWEVPASAWTHLKTINVSLKGAENLILATDPDREGEAIAWHLTEMLKQQDALSENINVVRVVFHEITDVAIKDALQSPRDLDLNLINAYLARRALDYLIGFTVSPLLWRKLPGCQSAGRVQSAALALICDKETEIDQFKAQEYWTVEADFCRSKMSPVSNGTSLTAELIQFDSKKLDQLSISNQEDAESIVRRLKSTSFSVLTSRKSKVRKNPPMPYITSTLQQDSSNKLHFTAAYTMKLAQKLYEGVLLSDEQPTGLITYTRTDGIHVSDAAANDIHLLVKERFGENFASKEIRKYFKKVKNAQEAHEAIRPTSIRRLPSTLVGILDEDSLKLYTLIWMRTLACQMEAAINDLVQVEIGNGDGDVVLRSSASRLNFLGYRAVYKDAAATFIQESGDDEDSGSENFEILSTVKSKEPLKLKNVRLDQHHTKPPARYSEGSLVKKLEELGIGRPSTYAVTLKVLQDRDYVKMKNRVLHPEFRGRMVSSFLSQYFAEVSDYSFTADMENELDNVSAGSTEWKGLLNDYWSRFKKYCDLARNIHTRQIEKMMERKFGHILFSSLPDSSRVCPSCSEGLLTFKVSRHGTGYFIGCDQHPNCRYILETLVTENVDDDVEVQPKLERCFQPKLLGQNPGSNENIYLKKGPFGYYVQLGEDRKEMPPKRSSISEKKDLESYTLEDAIELLRYPIILGLHPSDNQRIQITHSKIGFAVRHKRAFCPIPKHKDPKMITMENALKLLSSKKAKQAGRPKKVKEEASSLADGIIA